MRPFNQAGTSYVAAITGAATGIWVGKGSQFLAVKARVISFASGAATTFLAAQNGILDDSLQGQITPLMVTSTATAGTVVNANLPAPGAGLRHYINFIHIERFVAANLTAAATPVVIASANIPSGWAVSAPADAALAMPISCITSEAGVVPLKGVRSTSRQVVLAIASIFLLAHPFLSIAWTFHIIGRMELRLVNRNKSIAFN